MRARVTGPRPHRRGGEERGAAAVEFALIAIPLLTLLVGVIQFSLWFWSFQAGSHAAREGARLAAVDPCATGNIQARMIARVGSAADATPTATVTPPPSPVSVDNEITVEVLFETHEIGVFPDAWIPEIRKQATSRIENVVAPGC